MKKHLKEQMNKKVLLYDGSKGVMLQRKGLKGSESAESYNLFHPEYVSEIYESYLNAGSDVIQTNTFQANRVSLEKYGIADRFAEINGEGVKLAIKAAKEPGKVAVSAGPTSLFFQPIGEMSFEDAVSVFSEQAKASENAGASIINFETFTDLTELRAAVIAAKENTELEIIANATFEDTGKTLMGNPPDACALTLKALGVSAVGANCSGGPDSLLRPIREMHAMIGGPLCVKPNAGMPVMQGDEIIFTETPEHFASFLPEYVENGVRLIGGCCGTAPEHIAKMREVLDTLKVNGFCDTELPPAIASPYEVSALRKKTEVPTLRFSDEALKDALLRGDFDEINDYALGCVTEGDPYVLIDLSNVSDDADLWGFASNLLMVLRCPVIVKGEDAAIRFLRYYPGRCGYIAPNDARKEEALFYGALILDSSLLPV